MSTSCSPARGLALAVFVAIGVLVGCEERVELPTRSPLQTAQITVRPSDTPTSINRLLLGATVHWQEQGGTLWNQQQQAIDERRAAILRTRPPTVLRYPGVDGFPWAATIGPVAARSALLTPTGQSEMPSFGVDEFLSVRSDFGALALFTLNITSDSPDAALAWIKHVDSSTASAWWELGNEPYQRNLIHPESVLSPHDYALRCAQWLHAIKSVFPRAHVGIALQSPSVGGMPGGQFPDWVSTVLREVPPLYDFVTLHQTTLPGTYGAPSTSSVIEGALASTAAHEAELTALIRLLRELRPNWDPRIVIEYGPDLGSHTVLNQANGSLTAALLVTQTLILYSQHPEVVAATYRDLAGGYMHGTIRADGVERPTGLALRLWEQFAHGSLLQIDISSPTWSPTPGPYRFIPATKPLPAIVALASDDGAQRRLLLVNRHATLPVAIQSNWPIPTGTLHVLSGKVWNAGPDGPTSTSYKHYRWPLPEQSDRPPQTLVLPPHSLALLESDGQIKHENGSIPSAAHPL